MPKGTTGGSSNGWEQPDGDVFEMAAEWSEPDVPDVEVEEQPAEDAEPDAVGFVPPAEAATAPRVPKARKSTP